MIFFFYYPLFFTLADDVVVAVVAACGSRILIPLAGYWSRHLSTLPGPAGNAAAVRVPVYT